MAAVKTKQTTADVEQFIQSFADTEQKRADSFALVQLMQDITGAAPKLWGSSIIGFGSYHYTSERSKQEGDWPLLGFSPRKAAISLYVYTETEEQAVLLQQLGKFKMGKACIYVKNLADIKVDVLKKMMQSTVQFLEARYGKK
ncbi:DUF1801 domain-containing protein [Flavihumibacter sp. CACIAM 22H1]|uniref:DUF1801 domain-containing protein n=1 Tax=Flavihumibacter sp. CACIAM 22H1 TaxID=1812911 RepID=UPI0007A90F72|nr:DUF1801 domain-containing protein [Flavihumibacter sp. CACIAM 22H1]KYP13756.1 MAG: hypothetical protein A1D16_18980 [Flavihumibacter sp. CACIAM 22H1]